jgi:PAS domain S-box-containing protein
MTYKDEQDINKIRLELAMEAAGLDLWENDLVTGSVTRKATKIFVELGYDEEEAASHIDDIFAIIHPDDLPIVKTALNNHLTGVTAQYRCEFRLRAKNGTWVWYANYGKIIDSDEHKRGQRFIGVTFNIDDRERKEVEREAITRALKLLSECGTMLIHAENEHVLLDAICKLAVETGGYLMAWVGFAENDEAKSISWRAQSGYEEGYLDSIKITWSDSELGQGPAGIAIRTGSTVVNHDYQANPNMAPWREAASQRGYRSSIALPLIIKNHVFGVFSTYATAPFAFSNEEVALLEELASNLSYGIETLRTRAENKEAQIALKKENEKNIALLRNASDGIHILDSEGNVIEASDSFCTMLGYQRDEMIGMNVSRWDAQLSEVELRQVIRKQFSCQERVQFETRHKRNDGTIFDVEVSGFPLELDGKLVLFNSSRDITKRKHAEERLRKKQRQLIESEAQYRDLLKNLHTAIVVHTPDTRIIFSNQRASELLGLSEDQMRGKIAIDPAWCFINEQEEVIQPKEYPVSRVIATLKPLEALVLGVKVPDTTRVIWLLVNAFPEFNSDGNLKKVVVNFDDISARKQAEEKIHNLAFFDALTSLPNRRLLMDRLHSALSASARSKHYGAVLVIDMDRFKMINDVLGHDFGDLLLLRWPNVLSPVRAKWIPWRV